MTQQEFYKRYTYDIKTDCIGTGGFGSVYKAEDNYHHRTVAIKIAKVTQGQENIRLSREVEMVKKLPAHPNIAVYEECYTFPGHDGEYDFGIMQYYEEGSLHEVLKKNVLTFAQKQNILTKTLNGLQFLHNNGIIHRDLKPQNILIVKRGEEYIPKITDFGISKVLDINKSTAHSHSLTGFGTYAYSSPEQLKSTKIRKNADLWSFGVIAYQVFTGEQPFTTGGDTSEAGRQELFRQINSGVLPDKVNGIEGVWQRVIRECLVVDVEKRVRNCGEVEDIIGAKAGRREGANCKSAVAKGGGDETIKDPDDDKTRKEPPKPEPKPPTPEPKPKPEPAFEPQNSDKQKKKKILIAMIVLMVIGMLLIISGSFAIGAIFLMAGCVMGIINAKQPKPESKEKKVWTKKRISFIMMPLGVLLFFHGFLLPNSNRLSSNAEEIVAYIGGGLVIVGALLWARSSKD